jgi:1-phosphofructokinase
VIITVTPNPSVDRTFFIDELPRGSVIRSRHSRCDPSGKGVNVALALAAHGYDVLAALPAGGPGGAQMIEMMSNAGLAHLTVAIAGDIRSNISLVEPDGTVTKINAEGPVVDNAEISALLKAALDRAEDIEWVAGCGSLPAGADPHVYVRLIEGARERSIRTAIDTSGAALAAVLPYRPDLIKPNVEELAEVAQQDLRTVGDVVDAAELLRARGAIAVLASIGADGAVVVDGNGAVHGEAPLSHVVSAVGAGDALLAGFLAAGGRGHEALYSALTWAAGAVQQEGSRFSPAHLAVSVTIHAGIDRQRRLVEPSRTGYPDRSDQPAATH